MSRYVDIDKPIYVRCVDDLGEEVVTQVTIAELLDDCVGFLPVEDDVKKVMLCKDCAYNRYDFSDMRYCEKTKLSVWAGHYCGYGERSFSEDIPEGSL